MDSLYNNKTFRTRDLFENNLFNIKMLYAFQFNMLPNVHFIGNIDGEKTYHAIAESMPDMILSSHAYKYFERNSSKYMFDETVIIFKNNCIIGFDYGPL